MATALITGASEGIGRAFAKALVAKGDTVVGVARNEERLESLRDELGSAFTYIVADLGTVAGMDAVAALIKDRPFDLLVNNAGFGLTGDFATIPLDRARLLVRLNCEALMVLSHAFLESASPGAALINLSSVVSFLPMPPYALYAASKAFVTSFSEGISYQARQRGVYVMALCPGSTATEFHTRAGSDIALRSPAIERPEDVVATALQALAKRTDTVVVSGPLNKVAAFLPRLFPRKLIVSLTGRLTS